MLRIMKLTSSPHEKLQSRKTFKFGEIHCAKCTTTRVWEITYTQDCAVSLIISLLYSILLINRVHITCFIIHRLLWQCRRKLTQAFFFERRLRAFTILQQRSCKNIHCGRSFHPSDHLENKPGCCWDPLTKAANQPLSLSSVRVCEEETIAGQLHPAPSTTQRLLCAELARSAVRRRDATHRLSSRGDQSNN